MTVVVAPGSAGYVLPSSVVSGSGQSANTFALFTGSNAWSTVGFNAASGVSKLGTDGTVGGPSGSPLNSNIFYGAGTVRIPWSLNSTVTGPGAIASGSSNIVGFVPALSLQGSFTGMTGSDPGFAWGLDEFTTVGTGVAGTDVAGLTNIVGTEAELDVLNTAGTIAVARGGMSGVFFYGAAAGATITQAEGFRACAPTRVAGATAGTITTAYSLLVEQAALGTTATSLNVAGGLSYFGGTAQFVGNVYGVGGSGATLSLNGGASGSSVLSLQGNADGGNIQMTLGNATGVYAFKNSGGTQLLGISNAGVLTFISNLTCSGASMIFTLGGAGTYSFKNSGGTTKFQVGNAGGIGLWGAAAAGTQPTHGGVTTGYATGTGTAVTIDGTFTGNVGSTTYTIADIVAALKAYGLIVT